MTDPVERLSRALADHYRIERELGQGGMATVYLAQDLKHDRKVAVKVLKPELSAVLGGERFLNEIRVTANLQHPHILGLYDSGVADGFLYYVMPYVEGEPLDARLAREKQLGVEESVRIAEEMASALDYAHRHNVIHRDIKPANVLLQDGKALVADFGIALALKAAGGDRLTETGLSLGTPHYMSPEQAMGDRTVDARSDIYAMGAVLYEMLAGEPPHTGATIQAIMSRVLTEDPRPLGDLRNSVPAHVAAAVDRTLAKVPADRFASAAEFAQALRDPRITMGFGTARTGGRAVPAADRAPWWRDWRPWILAAAAALVGTVAATTVAAPPPSELPVARFAITIPDGQGLTGGPVNTVALSPDGRTIVYVGREGGSRVKLLRRELSTIEATPIAGSDGGSFPAISPDGRRVAFFGPGGMHVAPLAGGAPTTIADIQVVALGQAIWLDDNSFLVTESGGAISRLTMTGEMSRVASPDPSLSENYLGVYDLLPDGKRALVVAASGSGVNGTVLAIDVTSGERTVVMEELVNAVWYSDGYLVWATPSGQLLAAPFDPKRLTTSGQPTPLAERVRLAVGGPAQVGVSKNGSLVYVPEKPFNLMLLDEDGRREIIGEGRRFHNPRFSPDGRTLAMDFIQQGSRDVWTMDLRQRTLSRVTFEGDGHDAIWTPDGRYLYYITGIGIYRRRADGSGGADSVLVSGLLTGPLLFANRGRSLMTSPTGINGSFDIGMIDLGEERVQRPFLATPFGEESVALSPDERWLAYSSDETGRQELYVRPFPEGGAKTLVSLEGGNQPRWSPDGRVLYYWGSRHGVQYMIAAEVRADPVDGLVIEDREMLFEVSEFEPAAPHTNWDLSPDGRRFALVHQGTLSEMVFVQNWTEEVRASTGD